LLKNNVKSIEYKPTNSRETNNKCKNKLKNFASLDKDKYRNFIFEKSDVKLQGITV